MRDNNIKITVAGQVGSGKSTITYLLKQFLKKEGFDVTLEKQLDYRNEVEFDMAMVKNQHLRTESVKNHVKISLEEKQLCREAIEK